MSKLADHFNCSGCMACVAACHKNAISCRRGDDGHIYPVIDESKCVQCGACEKTCPVVSGFNYTQSKHARTFSAWSKNDEARRFSASGGAFLALAEYVIGEGGAVVGAASFEKGEARHIIIEKQEEIRLLQGSKYVQSDASDVYAAIHGLLKDGRIVLFSGTGCQVAGLLSLLNGKKYSGQLFTVDLICGGVPSRLLVDKFIECEPYEVKRIVSFRTKENGWKPSGFRYNMKVEDSSGNVHDYSCEKNLITDGFACEMTNRYSCYQCRYAGLNRLSDFTIGDFWGIDEFEEQHENGVSAVIAHSDNALMLLELMHDRIAFDEFSPDKVLGHNRRLVKERDKRYLLPERRCLTWMFSHLRYDTLKHIYAMDINNKSPWVLFKGYKYIMSKLLRKKNS